MTQKQLEAVFAAVDSMSPQELNQLHQYISQKRKTTTWVVAKDDLNAIDEAMREVQQQAETMDEDEINALLDDVIAEIR